MSLTIGALRAELSGESVSYEKALDRSTAATLRSVRSISRAGKQLQSIGTGLQRVGLSLTVLSAPLVAMGVDATRTFATFESGMNRVRALTGATGEDFEALENQAKELGRTTVFSATQAADGMGFLAQAGFDTTQILAAMPGVLELAAAAQLELGRAADITSNVLSGYGLQVQEIGRVNDVLTKAFTSANTDLSQLGQAFKFAGPVAKSAGISFESTAAALALMGQAGIQSTMAGTSLRGAIVRLLNPTAKAKRLMEELGLEVTDSTGRLRPLDQIIRQLEPNASNTAAIMEIFGQRAGPAMASLVTIGADALSNFTDKLENAGGVAKQIAETQMEGLQGELTELRSAAEGLSIEVGELLAPAVKKAAEGLKIALGAIQSDLVPAFQALPQAAQLAAGGLLVLAAATGPVAFGLGLLVNAMGTTVLMLTRLGVVARVATTLSGLQAVMFTLGNTTALLSVRLAFLSGQTALYTGAQRVLTAATGLATTAKLVFGSALTATAARLGLSTAATTASGLALKAWTVAAAGASLAARGLAFVLGALGPAIAVVAVGIAAWQFGTWISESTVLGDAFDRLAGKMFGASEEAIEFSIAMKRAGSEVEFMRRRTAELRKQVSGEALVKDMRALNQAMEEIQAAGQLDVATMRRIGIQAKRLQEEGQELTEGLQNILNWMDLLAKQGQPTADAFDDVGDAVKTFGDRVEEARQQIRDAKLGEEIRRVAEIMEGQFPKLELAPLRLATTFDLPDAVGKLPTPSAFQQSFLDELLTAGTPGSFRQIRGISFERAVADAKERIKEAERASVDWSDALQDVANQFQAMGRAGTILSTIAAGIAGIGASLDRLKFPKLAEGQGGGFLGGIFDFKKLTTGQLLNNLASGLSIASAGIGIAKSIFSLFGSNPVKDAAEQVGRRLGVEISEALAEQIAKDTARLGDEVAANLVNLGSIIEEAGGVEAFGVSKAIASARDLFSMIQTGKLSVQEAGAAFDEVFGQIAPFAIDKTTGIASAGFRELIALNEQFGTNSAAVADFTAQQTQMVIGGLKRFVENASVTTQAGATGMANAVVAAFQQLRAQGVPAKDALEQLSPVIEKLRADFEAAGLDGTAAFAALEAQMAVFRDEVTGPALEGIRATTDVMVGLANQGLLTEETFQGLAGQVAATREELIEQGKTGPEVMQAMQPDLQRIWQLQQDFGFAVDESTQKMLDEAEAAGLVGDQMRDAQERSALAMERTAEVLEALARHLGVDIPEAAARGARGVEESFSNIRIPPIDVPINLPGVPIPPGVDTGLQSFREGGEGDFRSGRLVALHGREVILPADRPSGIVDELAQRISARIGGGGGRHGEVHRFQIGADGLNVLFEIIFEASQDGRLRIHRAALVDGS